MAVPPRLLAVAVLGVGPLILLAGCGGEASGAKSTLVAVQASSYVVQDPIATTTTTTVPPAPIEGQVSPTEQIYVVVPNDSLSKIASLYDVTLEALVNYNAWAEGIAHPIFQGDEIKIPPAAIVPSVTPQTDTGTDTATGSTPASETPTEGTLSNGDDCPTTYTIADGDTSRIRVADKFGITYEEMDAANANTSGYASFIVGTEITIPCPS
jgi:LysM repeat protein